MGILTPTGEMPALLKNWVVPGAENTAMTTFTTIRYVSSVPAVMPAPADGGRVPELEAALAAMQLDRDNLKTALESARVIGAAVGIVMALQKVTYDAAFALLIHASQIQNRKLREIADEVVQYGAITGDPRYQVDIAS